MSVLSIYLSALSHICDLSEKVELHGTSDAVIRGILRYAEREYIPNLD
jgi:hypothetical protein